MLNRITLLLLIAASFTACKRDFFAESGPGLLTFSNDTIIFDTVFTTVGTTTQVLKVYNNNNNPVTISTIDLSSMQSSAVYRINVDGVSGTHAENIKIAANDSLYIFVEATVNPLSGSNSPFLITDSLLFRTNGTLQDVDLVAYGQNAHFYTPHDNLFFIEGKDTTNYKYHSISEPTTWSNDLPHVIYGYVIIEPQAELTIEAGAQIYFHKNSGILVGNPLLANEGGTLIVAGELGNEVSFQGDRLDAWYADVAGQWDRIWFTPGSVENKVDYAIIRNGTIGLHADTLGGSSEAVLTVSNTLIENMSDIGILGQGTHIEGYNNVITDCGRYTLVLNIGGNYDFTHCTFANYWSQNVRNTASILLNNYYEDANGIIQHRPLEQANFTNCILTGSFAGELELQESPQASFNYLFDHCLLKIHPDSSLSNLNHNNSSLTSNSDLLFISIANRDFQLHQLSSAIDAGTTSEFGADILGNLRTGTPDIGAYEKVD